MFGQIIILIDHTSIFPDVFESPIYNPKELKVL